MKEKLLYFAYRNESGIFYTKNRNENRDDCQSRFFFVIFHKSF
jgi:hypothetical protein